MSTSRTVQSPESTDPVVSTYLNAAASVGSVLTRIPAAMWSGPGIGEWDLRALVGHTSRALITVLTYLDRPADHVDLETPEEYYALSLRGQSAGSGQEIVERGRNAGRELGEDPARRFDELVHQVTGRLAAADLDSVIATAGGGVTVRAYLPTRTFELVVHGMDIAQAADQPTDFGSDVLDEACQLAARTAVHVGHGPLLLRGLTGRTDLPHGFSVVG